MLSFTNKSLNKEIPVPLYYQLKELLLEYIREHPDNLEPISTELELSAHFDISRPTVRQAINELVVEGYLYRIKGKGTFISKPKIKQDFLLTLDSFNSEMQKKGLDPSTKLIESKVIKSDEKVSKALDLTVGSNVFELRRLRSTNQEPIVIVVTYVPYDKCPGLLEKDLERESLYTILEKDYGLTICKAIRNLESVAAGQYEAQLLGIKKGAPVQFFESITYLDDGTPIEYSLAKYRGDRNKFTFEFKRGR
jgi:GntR family transcriptional regulator, N-acetylglucosamine utilization regulator